MDFVKSAISFNLRLDGRKLDDPFEPDVVPNISSVAHGSSQVSLGDSIVQTTVNFSIGSPDDSAPDEGSIELSICGTSVFENAELSQRNYEILCNILYDTQFQHDFVDLRSLCILPGHFCWILRISSTVLKSGGSLVDALSIGVLSALKCCEVPAVNVMVRDEFESVSDSSNLQVKISSEKNPFIGELVDRLPLVTSVGKVGGSYVWSLTREEESCCDGVLSVAVDRTGRCLCVRGNGPCFDQGAMDSLVSKSVNVTLENFRKLDQFLQCS